MDTLVLATLAANTAALAAIVIGLAVAYCWPHRQQTRR
jgi:hypothetical protein